MMGKIRYEMSKKSTQQLIIKLVAILIVLAALSFLLLKPITSLIQNSEVFREKILSYGNLAPLVYIGISAAQVVIGPIPGQVLGLFSGFTFGWFYGTIYTMIGIMIGSIVAFLISRQFGRPFVERIVDKKQLEKFDYISKDKGTTALFLIYLLPFMPDDIVCFIAGLTTIRIRTLLLVALVGRFPGTLALNLIGSGFSNMSWHMWITITIIAAVVFLAFLYRERIENEASKILEKNKK